MSEKKEQKGIGDVKGNTIGSAARFNAGKTRYELLPTHLLKNTADVLAFGASKYSEWNWARGFPLSTIIGCMKRHIAAIERGEDIDPESGLPHIGHVGCNLVFFEHVLNLIAAGHTELDDLPREWFSYKPKEKATPVAESENGLQEPLGLRVHCMTFPNSHDTKWEDRQVPDKENQGREHAG